MNRVVFCVCVLGAMFSLSLGAENRFEKLPKIEFLTTYLTDCRLERERRLANGDINMEEFDFLVSRGSVSLHYPDGRPMGYSLCSK